MQKDLSDATNKLSEGINKMYDSGQTQSLMTLVKKQAEEIDRRGQLVMKMEESLKLQKENIEKLLVQNKHLEAMLESMKAERQNLLEEIKELKAKPKTQRTPRKTKSVKKEGDVTEAA